MPLIVAVVNSARESLEIAHWTEGSEDELNRVERQMLSLAERLYPKLSRINEKHPLTMSAVGRSESQSKLNGKAGQENVFHYALYEGRCLDPKKLSYFMPERTVEEGNLTSAEAKKLLARRTPISAPTKDSNC